MKGKRHTTEQKIRILRSADGGKSIVHQPKPKTNIASGQVFGTRSRGQIRICIDRVAVADYPH